MKLIDILVQELPKRGGWPEGVKEIAQGSAGTLFDMESQDGERLFEGVRFDITEDRSESIVNYEQYATALIASWTGEGLPPVGCECEWYDSSSKDGWTKVKIMYLSRWVIVMRSIEPDLGRGVDVCRDLVFDKLQEFRPIRSEADKKRDDAIAKITDAICGEIADTGWETAEKYAVRAYDAIAAGKIPGIKLEKE